MVSRLGSRCFIEVGNQMDSKCVVVVVVVLSWETTGTVMWMICIVYMVYVYVIYIMVLILYMMHSFWMFFFGFLPDIASGQLSAVSCFFFWTEVLGRRFFFGPYFGPGFHMMMLLFSSCFYFLFVFSLFYGSNSGVSFPDLTAGTTNYLLRELPR